MPARNASSAGRENVAERKSLRPVKTQKENEFLYDHGEIMAELKYREIGIFKSKDRADLYAQKRRAMGKLVRVEKEILPVYGGAAITGVAYSVMEKRRTPIFGKHYKIDTRV